MNKYRLTKWIDTEDGEAQPFSVIIEDWRMTDALAQVEKWTDEAWIVFDAKRLRQDEADHLRAELWERTKDLPPFTIPASFFDQGRIEESLDRWTRRHWGTFLTKPPDPPVYP